MARNKPRLQLALYARPKHPGTYHYALLVCPKSLERQHKDPATKYHVLNTIQNISGTAAQPWRYERSVIDVDLERRLLVRIVIGKVTSLAALDTILEAVPVYQIDNPNVAMAQSFNCVTWVRAALEALRKHGAVAKLGAWEVVHGKAVEYVAKKKEEGRWSGAGRKGVPTLDLLLGEEVIE